MSTMSKRARTEVVLLVRGTVIDCASRTELRVLERAVLGVDATGFVLFSEDDHVEALSAGDNVVLRSGESFELSQHCDMKELPPRGFLVPGFVDTHTHAPQFAIAGLGYELQLLEWLKTYTFPSEAKFESLEYAARICHKAVARTLRAGTTSAVWRWGLEPTRASKLLVPSCHLLLSVTFAWLRLPPLGMVCDNPHRRCRAGAITRQSLQSFHQPMPYLIAVCAVCCRSSGASRRASDSVPSSAKSTWIATRRTSTPNQQPTHWQRQVAGGTLLLPPLPLVPCHPPAAMSFLDVHLVIHRAIRQADARRR